ncbi:prepilin-type N-terminal cleavage/methylation domain-containing protein [Deinococcus taeanensis]|uniref:PulJ/GspJ family protein n=1 Tax=Deinococcus taeanensis TaxID=2737050 RepID=UPI001CDD7992|nr:prepilin-type N-terminal cleavage/methylation domain-containing protein [Deinococcus taeanensis]UBV42652.1 prepilin-type N-terminal cleavage/methylation domain-containing protein [Deinococcus taeanensis]
MVPERHTQGFTILEVLVSIAVLAIVLVMVSSIMTGLFSSNRQVEQRQNLSVRLQETAEDLRRHWLDPAAVSPTETRGTYRLRRTCLEGFTVPAGMNVTVWDVTPDGQGNFTVSSSYALSSDCAAATQRPNQSVRRVRIQTSGGGASNEVTFEMYGG